MNLTSINTSSYPTFSGNREIFVGTGKGPSSYVTGGDLVSFASNYRVDSLFGSVYTLSGTYIVTPIPVSNGFPNSWKLKWNPAVTSSSGSAVTAKLGSAANYALLASAGITNTGTSLVTGGNVGSYPTATITGLTSANLTPPSVIDNTNAQAAETALAAAITYYQGLTPTTSGLTNLSTGGNGSTVATYTAGNYFGAAGLTMPSGIILDAQGNANAQFVFVAGSTINLASGQSIALVNGAQASNVVFVAGSAFTSVATSTVNGNILAVSGITLGGGSLNGRALVTTGPVTISAATATYIASSASNPGEVAAGTDLSAEVVEIGGIGSQF
jgi:hypothetical protein